MKQVGFIVNPFAGMGGAVGLKGTDGVVCEALKRGALRQAPQKAIRSLKELLPVKDDIIILTASGDMGEFEAKELGFNTRIVYESHKETTSADTICAAQKMRDADILLFAGGDGTARDIVTAAFKGPVIGIPAGVKIHSPVYAIRPEAAGALALKVIQGTRKRTKEAEVLDIDEDACREGKVITRLFGYLNVPDDTDLLQHGKASSPLSERCEQEIIASDMAARMKDGCSYLIGPGSTTRALMDLLGLPCTLLGIDLIKDKKLVQEDMSEKDILKAMDGNDVYLILTPTGGQGFLLGRGNQQISPSVIRKLGKDHIFILATREKLFNLQGRPLLVDTGDPQADELLCGYKRVIVGADEEQMIKIENNFKK